MNEESIATGGNEHQDRADAEKKKPSESKRTSRLVRNPNLTGRTRRRAKHRVEKETNKAKIETFLGFGEAMIYSEKHLHEGKAQGQVSTKTSPC